jgi:TfoX/Sxy family transcriptional regulator of competence genes
VSTGKRPMPKWTKAPDWIVALFDQLVSGLPGVERRKMFGYPAAFKNGHMACGVFQSSMMLRLPESGRRAFLEQFDTRLFEPVPGRPMKEYVLVPETLVKLPEVLRPWIRKSLEYLDTLPGKKKAEPKGSQKKRH